ncbi:MAG: phage holin family protein [Armatimonadetes bacterium]|nr:phage holin family protein [Armatimonadota bacterium]
MIFIIRWILGVAAVWLTVFIGDLLHVGLRWPGFWRALLFFIVLGVINAFIRPIVKALTLPLNCLTFGLFAFVVNALLFWAADAIINAGIVQSFWGALFGSLALGLLSGVINQFIKQRSRSRRF